MKSRSEDFKVKDATSYDSVSVEFDHFTKRLTEPLAERLVSLAALQRHERVLDIGTGTGIVALPAATLVGGGGDVMGVDLSLGMVVQAKKNAALFGVSNVEFRQVDAESLDLPTGSFDVVLSLFALLHFPNPDVALKEMFRVLRPGGRIVIGIGSGPNRFSFQAVVEALHHIQRWQLQTRGKLLIAPAALNSFLLRSLPPSDEPEQSWLANQGRSRAATVVPLMAHAGFKIVKTSWQGHESGIGSPEEFWDLQRTFSSIARKRLGRLSEDRIQSLRGQFLQLCRNVQAHGGRLVYPFAAFFVVAKKPVT